jgi:hypothetical protein
MAEQNDTLSGIWNCWLTYPSADDQSYDETQNVMEGYQRGSQLVLQSKANEEGSYTFVRLTIDDDIATGIWYESTSPTGTFEGALYSGSGQLIIRENGQNMDGMWAGAGVDRESGKKRIYTGEWKLSRQTKA